MNDLTGLSLVTVLGLFSVSSPGQANKPPHPFSLCWGEVKTRS